MCEKYEIAFNNKSDPTYEAMFNDLILEVFGFSFAPWFACVPWSENYESYSIIEGGVMLANVSIFKADLVVNGQGFVAHQFGAVATRKSARGRGLSRILMVHVLARYPETPAYLVANEDVADFYPRFGFRQVQTYLPQFAVSIDNEMPPVLRKMDDKHFRETLANRAYFSKPVDCRNAQNVALFHLLMAYEEHIYFLRAPGAYVIARQRGADLFIADIIARKPIHFALLAKELPFKGVGNITFGFCPRGIGVEPDWVRADAKVEPFFIHGAWELPAFFRFPALAET